MLKEICGVMFSVAMIFVCFCFWIIMYDEVTDTEASDETLTVQSYADRYAELLEDEINSSSNLNSISSSYTFDEFTVSGSFEKGETEEITITVQKDNDGYWCNFFYSYEQTEEGLIDICAVEDYEEYGFDDSISSVVVMIFISLMLCCSFIGAGILLITSIRTLIALRKATQH